MTEAARKVLSDCRISLRLLEEAVELNVWRVHWVGALTLIRAVGHVLHKVDGREPKIRRLADQGFRMWKSDPAHRIFLDFIDRERNDILKEYQFGYEPQEAVGVVFDGGLLHFLGDNIYRPLNEGYGKNEDARDVYREAIEWWHARLDEIDREAKKRDHKVGA